jgi:hypothetical protein
MGSLQPIPSHPIPSHPIPSHRITSPTIPSHTIPAGMRPTMHGAPPRRSRTTPGPCAAHGVKGQSVKAHATQSSQRQQHMTCACHPLPHLELPNPRPFFGSRLPHVREPVLVFLLPMAQQWRNNGVAVKSTQQEMLDWATHHACLDVCIVHGGKIIGCIPSRSQTRPAIGSFRARPFPATSRPASFAAGHRASVAMSGQVTDMHAVCPHLLRTVLYVYIRPARGRGCRWSPARTGTRSCSSAAAAWHTQGHIV